MSMSRSEGYKLCDKASSTMNFESIYTDVGAQASPREDSNESGTTLKAHDYIGLSEVSSANSSNEGHAESGRVGVLDLNESATVLRLGPPAAPKADAKAEAGRDGRAAEVGKVGAGGSHRNSHAILEEFRKAQAMKAASAHGAGHAGHGAMVKGTHPMTGIPMYHRPIKGYEAGQKSGYGGAGFGAAYGVFGASGGGVKNNGVKRGFSETVGMHGEQGPGEGMGMGGSDQGDVKVKVSGGGKIWMGNGSAGGYGMPRRGPVGGEGGESSAKSQVEVKAVSSSEAIGGVSNEQPSSPAQNQAVGWPPVKSFARSNNLPKPAPPLPAPSVACPSLVGKDSGSAGANSNRLVKIYMDGVPFGRKVDLKANNRYEKLYPALEEMFQQFISGHFSGSQTSSSNNGQFGASSSRKLNFLDGSEYVLIYEDHEGDFMLVGDVPWDLFVNTVKRLRIMKGSEQVNLGQKGADPLKSQGAVG